MSSKTAILKTMFWAPLVVALFRVVITLIILIWNPQAMSFRFIQLIPLAVILGTSFFYFKLYSDGDPVISLALPTIIHFVLILVFKRTLEVIPFVVPVILDILYLVVKGIKGSMYPFEFEGDDVADALDAFSDGELDVGLTSEQ